jgi:hypothetical protein
MLRIVASQLKLNALLLFTLFIGSNLIYLFQARMGGLYGIHSGVIQVSIVTASLMLVAMFVRHQQIKGDVIFRSLPLRPSTVVLAMFVLAFTIMLTNLAYGLSVQLINTHIGPWVPERFRSWSIHHLFSQFDAGYAVEHSWLARAFAFTFVTSVSLPLIIRYGTMTKILVGYLIVLLTWTRVINYLLHFSLYTSFFLGLSRWMFFAILIMITILAVSFWLSLRLYRARDL